MKCCFIIRYNRGFVIIANVTTCANPHYKNFNIEENVLNMDNVYKFLSFYEKLGHRDRKKGF